MKHISIKQMQMIKHAWGFDENAPGFRTHYCTQKANPDMIALVEGGYFGGEYEGNFGEGYAMYYLTPKAIEMLKDLKGEQKWFGRIIYMPEGIECEREFKTEAEAKAYALGVNDMKDVSDPDTDFTEDYVGVASNVESETEP